MINKIKEMYKQQGISEQVYDFSEKICADFGEIKARQLVLLG